MPVRGGSRLKAHLRRQRHAVRTLPKGVSVGFHSPFAAMVAAQNEFGMERPDRDGGNIPERPAFRRGIPEANDAVRKHMVGLGMMPQPSDVEKAGDVAAAAIRQSYLTFKGAPPSEATVQRKAGTPGAGRQLVGPHGPRLIGLLSFKVIQ